MSDHKIVVMVCCVLMLVSVLLAGCTSEQGRGLVPATPSAMPRTAGSGDSYHATLPAGQGNGNPEFDARFVATELLSRPGPSSVTVHLVPNADGEVVIEYGTSPGDYGSRTAPVSVKAGTAQSITIQGLLPDTQYYYRTAYRGGATDEPVSSPVRTFHTQRAPGSSFVFAIQADSHLDERADEALYQVTLENEAGGSPDFLIDLGDTFMTDKLPVKNSETILGQYLRQRSALSTIGHSVPVYLVLGNHDGEAGYTAGDIRETADLSLKFRKDYFPNPEPDGFYTGNSERDVFNGLPQDYYAWRWGDALFIVLDPFRYTVKKPGGKTSGWEWTLGERQYQWLRKTLEQNTAEYTFVFAHHLVGGDSQGRGGIEYAPLYEWGGENPDGTSGFAQYRPGWEMPIHQLMVEHNVTAFFHGHDHFFAMQERDGIIYQEVPQPATTGSGKAEPGAEYGYRDGEMRRSPGHLRVTVSPESARVDYIYSAVPGGNRGSMDNGAVAYSYTLTPRSHDGGGA